MRWLGETADLLPVSILLYFGGEFGSGLKCTPPF